MRQCTYARILSAKNQLRIYKVWSALWQNNEEGFGMTRGDGKQSRVHVSSETAEPAANPYNPGGSELFRLALYKFFHGRKSVYRCARQFAFHFELELGKQAMEANADVIRIELDPGEPVVKSVRFGNRKIKIFLEEYEPLWSFIQEIGIQEICLDPRLEQNQIEDVFNLLYFYRFDLSNDPDHADTPAAVRELRRGRHVHTACTLLSLQNSILTIAYTYCTLRYSHLVRWFEGRQRKFQDHRALFRAAPWYGLFFLAVVLGPSFLYAVFHESWYLSGMLFFAGVTLFALIYLLFNTIGSIEYDYEEKAYQLRQAFGQLQKYSLRVQSDIQKARGIQQQLLPVFDSLPFGEQICWIGETIPASEVGGDFFDIQRAHSQKLAFLFCDVSGHGMAAAFITAVIKTSFQACLDRKLSLRATAEYLNANLCRLTPTDSFAAAFLGIYNPATHLLMYCSAGHIPEPWRIPGNPAEPIQALQNARNLLLGVQPDIIYKTARCTLKPGDKLMLVSDGIVEGENIDGQEYSQELLELLLERHRTEPIRELVEQIFHSVQEFTGVAEQLDDQTIVAAQILS